jgi:hypothetical protein
VHVRVCVCARATLRTVHLTYCFQTSGWLRGPAETACAAAVLWLRRPQRRWLWAAAGAARPAAGLLCCSQQMTPWDSPDDFWGFALYNGAGLRAGAGRAGGGGGNAHAECAVCVCCVWCVCVQWGFNASWAASIHSASWLRCWLPTSLTDWSCGATSQRCCVVPGCDTCMHVCAFEVRRAGVYPGLGRHALLLCSARCTQPTHQQQQAKLGAVWPGGSGVCGWCAQTMPWRRARCANHQAQPTRHAVCEDGRVCCCWSQRWMQPQRLHASLVHTLAAQCSRQQECPSCLCSTCLAAAQVGASPLW